jgi:hypothetical protein
VHYMMIVAVHNGREYLPNNLCGNLLIKNSKVDDLIEEFSTLAKLCHEVEMIRVLVVLQETHDVRMFLQARNHSYGIVVLTSLVRISYSLSLSTPFSFCNALFLIFLIARILLVLKSMALVTSPKLPLPMTLMGLKCCIKY